MDAAEAEAQFEDYDWLPYVLFGTLGGLVTYGMLRLIPATRRRLT